MKLVDTVALIGFLDPNDRLHKRSAEHLERVYSENDVFAPVSSLLETDLLMKFMRYSDSEREISWVALQSKIAKKVIPNTPSSILGAVKLQKEGMDYFDSLVSSLAKETVSLVITTDKRIGDDVETEW